MRFCRTFALLTALIGTVLAAAPPATAEGTAFRYNTAQRVIKACVLAVDVDADGVVDAPVNPYIFEGMRRPALTPDDWVFENPLAGGTVVPGRTPEVLVRGTADYWVVELTDESATRLVGMDVIYLSATTLDLSQEQQDGLRAAVEGGAVLWIDSATDPADPTVVTQVVNFPWLMEDGTDNVFGYVDTDNYALDAIDESNGLLRDPHPLNSSAVARLGNWPNRADYDATAYTTGHFLVPTELDSRFHTIIENVAYDADGNELNAWPWAVAMEYGSGNVLVTTGGVGRDVVEWLFEGDTPTADFRPSPNFLQAPDVKLALNAVQWKDRWQQARETPRAAATSVARAPFPLDVVWQYPDVNDDPAAVGTPVPPVIGAVVSTPVYDRSMVYAVSIPTSPAIADVPGYLLAFDMRPEQDRDGDQQADDGVADYSLGSPYDLVWYSVLPENATTRYSSPTLTSAYDYSQVVLISGVDTDDNVAWVAAYNASLEDLGPSPVHPEAPGDLLWRREIPAYGLTAEVISLSSPIVHNGYVYVLASEYDSALGANQANSTYGRAHCFELEYPWGIDADPWANDAAWWVYPAYQQDLDGDGAVVGDEPQRSLPPFHNPQWLAADAALYPTGRTPLPPAPGAMPVVHADGNAVDGTGVDALLTFGTPVSFRWTGGAVQNAGNRGGSQYTLVPTPYRSVDFSADKPAGFELNADYFLARTNYVMDTYTQTRLNLGTNPIEPAGLQIDDRIISYNPGAVRESILNAVDQGWVDPLEAQQNLAALIDYTQPAPDPAITDEAHSIPGPVRWKRVLERGEPINQPGAMGTDSLAVTAGRPVNYAYMDPLGPPPPSGSGSVSELDAATGATRWSYDPSRTMPGRTAGANGESTTAAAFDDETIIVGQSAVDYDPAAPSVVSSVIGLNRQMDVQINLREGVDGEYPVAVSTALWVRNADPALEAWQYLVLSPASYAVDPWLGRIMFPADSASNLIDEDGTELGISIYGRILRVEWADGTVEDHLVPAIERFHHTQNYIRLRHHPVVDGSVTIERPDGTPIDVATVAWRSDPQDFGYPDNAAPYDMRFANLDGWVDVSAALDVDGVPVRPGDELLVSYTGWLEDEGRWITVPNPADNIAVERHQKPVEFGPSLSSPAVAGDTIHLGTQGRDAILDATFDGAEPAKTMLSLIWNKANGFVRSGVSEPASTQPGFAGAVPVVSGAPSITEDRVFVGSRLKNGPDALGIGPGYVSAMAPWRVLICDTNRIVETTGSEPSWVCTGTSSPQRTQDFIGEDVQRPFSRPAKASRLDTGNILVVDSGNHRVVEVDRAGRIVWPLDPLGYEYYTSPDNRALKLSRPADAHRYYEVIGGYPHWITVIADTGNARVIEIDTTFHNPDTGVLDGRQRHDIRVLTPTYVRFGGGATRVRYTSAAPIRDPYEDTVVGYLCAASNLNQLLVVTAETADQSTLVNPFASVSVVGGNVTPGSTWQHWAWLYDADPTDANNVSNQPLQFENIKHVDVQRIGGTIHVAVTCSRYIGRSGEAVHPLADDGAGVFEFQIDVSAGDPTLWELAGFGTGWPSADPHWVFVGADYKGRTMTTIDTAAGSFDKRWYPVCSQRLSSDTVLITNSLTQIENATYTNIGERDAVLGSHIFEVQTTAGGYQLDADRSVPAPGEMWIDPFTQPAYAEISR